jgi:hypothetical protein
MADTAIILSDIATLAFRRNGGSFDKVCPDPPDRLATAPGGPASWSQWAERSAAQALAFKAAPALGDQTKAVQPLFIGV